MELRSVVLNTFLNAIDKAPINSELKKSAKEHDKIRTVINNIYNQLVTAQAVRMAKGKGGFKKQTITDTVESFATQFILGLENQANKRIESDLEKIRLKAEADKKLDLEKASEGNFVGEYEELKDIGVIDERSVDG